MKLHAISAVYCNPHPFFYLPVAKQPNNTIMRAMIIDFHTHIYPESRAKKVLADVSRRANIPCYADGTMQSLLTSMAQGGIDLSVISRIAVKAERVDTVNHWLQQQVREGIVPLATVHPDLPVTSGWIEDIRHRGFKGFKLHPDYQQFFVDDKRMYPFYAAMEQEGMPVLFHAGLDRGLPPPVHATPKRLLRVYRDFPGLTMVAAHMGGEDNYDETEQYLLGTGIYLDTSFVLRVMPLNTLKRFLRHHPIDRVLFGSDSPFKSPPVELKFLMSLPFLSLAEKEKIAGGNAAALLRL
jgi:predicted TIM-barrel fold metal-dependent hydrolase